MNRSDGRVKNKGILFTVVVPLYNKEGFIGRCIESVLAQSYENFELIIVNDGSTDASLELASAYSDNRIVILNQSNKGVSSARNLGISHSKGEYIAFIDADDEWCSDHLGELSSIAIKFPEACMLATTSVQSLNQEKPTLRPSNNMNSVSIEIDYFNISSKKVGVINSSNSCVKRSVLTRLDGFKCYSVGEDLELWARVALEGSVVISSAITAIYHRGTGGIMDKHPLTDMNAKRYLALDDVEKIDPSCSTLIARASEWAGTDKEQSILGYIRSRFDSAVRFFYVSNNPGMIRNCSTLYKVVPGINSGRWYFFSLSPIIALRLLCFFRYEVKKIVYRLRK